MRSLYRASVAKASSCHEKVYTRYRESAFMQRPLMHSWNVLHGTSPQAFVHFSCMSSRYLCKNTIARFRSHSHSVMPYLEAERWVLSLRKVAVKCNRLSPVGLKSVAKR
jgi:hypothetical protein